MDWAVGNSISGAHKTLNYNLFGRFGIPISHLSLEKAVRADQFVPKDTRTQIGIAMQKRDLFLVRYIIDYVDSAKNGVRHTFMLNYEGTAPKDLVGKVYWGTLIALGGTPNAWAYLEPPFKLRDQSKWSTAF